MISICWSKSRELIFKLVNVIHLLSKYLKSIASNDQSNNNCVSLVDMVDMLYNYTKTCNEIFTEKEKYNIIKIISKYKLLLNIHHENDIELYFITSDIYYELQKDV